MPIELLAPELAHQLALRRILGVRNSTHTIVKILQPFAGPALRLVSYTHPEYLNMLSELLQRRAPAERGDVLPDARHRRRDGRQRQPRPADRLLPWRRADRAGRARRARPTHWRRRPKAAMPPPPPTGSCGRCAASSRCRRRLRRRWRIAFK
jgi:hypothetical protein